MTSAWCLIIYLGVVCAILSQLVWVQRGGVLGFPSLYHFPAHFPSATILLSLWVPSLPRAPRLLGANWCVCAIRRYGRRHRDVTVTSPRLLCQAAIVRTKLIARGAFATVWKGSWGHIPVAVKIPLGDWDGYANFDVIFGPFLAHLSASPHPTRLMGYALPGAHADRVLMGAWIPMLWPIWGPTGFRWSDPEAIKEFGDEASRLQSIRHPNLVTFYGAGTTADAQPFLVFELMELGSLQSLLQSARGATLDWQVRLRFAAEIAAGMQHLHDIGIIHRDLKPANCTAARGIACLFVCCRCCVVLLLLVLWLWRAESARGPLAQSNPQLHATTHVPLACST